MSSPPTRGCSGRPEGQRRTAARPRRRGARRLVLRCFPASAHAAQENLYLAEAVGRLPAGTESRDGYSRDRFRHWNTGDDPADGCNTRAEVLIAEAVDPPAITAGCRLSG